MLFVAAGFSLVFCLSAPAFAFLSSGCFFIAAFAAEIDYLRSARGASDTSPPFTLIEGAMR